MVRRTEGIAAACLWATACLLPEAGLSSSGAGGAAGAGGAGTSVTAAQGGAAGASGGGGQGGEGLACGSGAPGEVTFTTRFAELGPPAMGVADQRILGLAVAPAGPVVTGWYAHDLQIGDTDFPDVTAPFENGFVAWLDASGLVRASPAPLTYAGGSPLPRGLSTSGDVASVVGHYYLDVDFAGTSLNAAANVPDAFYAVHGPASTVVEFGEPTTPPPTAAITDLADVAVDGGATFASGFTQIVLNLGQAGVFTPPVAGGSHFVTRLGGGGWATAVVTGSLPNVRMPKVAAAGGRVFAAFTLQDSGSVDGTPFDTFADFAVVVVELDADNGELVRSTVLGGDTFGVDRAFLHALAVDEAGGTLVLGGAFSGELAYGGGGEVLVAQEGEDAFAMSLDARSLTVTSAARFGGPGPQALWAAALDPCGNAVLAGAFDVGIDLGGSVLQAVGPSDVFLVKLQGSDVAAAPQVFVRQLGDLAHAPCAGSSDLSDQRCYHVRATSDAVYLAGSFGGTLDAALGLGPAVSGEDGFLVGFSP